MSKVVRHLKQNVVAYLALFVALGGTSYAAIRLPTGSVGNRQIRNHSITPIKFDRNTIGGYVRMWARVSADGKVLASRPRATVVNWFPAGSQFLGGKLHWNTGVSSSCFALATTESLPGASYASDEIASLGNRGGTTVAVSLSEAVPVDLAVICPQP